MYTALRCSFTYQRAVYVFPMFGMSHRITLRLLSWHASSWVVMYLKVSVFAPFHSMVSRRFTSRRRAMFTQFASLSALSVWPFLIELYTLGEIPSAAACFASLG